MKLLELESDVQNTMMIPYDIVYIMILYPIQMPVSDPRLLDASYIVYDIVIHVSYAISYTRSLALYIYDVLKDHIVYKYL